MKIAFFTYPSAFQNVGGGEILLLKLREYLMREGVAVDLFDSWSAKVEQYDFIHVFGSVKDCLGLVKVANARKVKVAITPLVWSDARRALFAEGSLRSKVDFIVRHYMKVLFPKFPSARRELLLSADLLFPNSQVELTQTRDLFAVPESKMRVMPNGVDRSFLDADHLLFQEKHGKEPFILGVGRIEPRKNQLNLIRAVKKIPGKKLILIGSPVSGYENYFEQCRTDGADFTVFLPTISHGDALLKSAYAACEVFVLQGWFETPGLVAMEAALAGARVAATQGGSTREYFENFVDYLDPANVFSITESILKSIARPKTNDFKNHILSNYTWDKVAQKTISCYTEFLSKKTEPR